MSSFGSQIRKRVAELHKLEADVPKIIDEAAETATIEAVRTATQHTPPNGAKIAGTHARSGEMAGAWAVDSVTTPVRGKTILANNQQYASYVNNGHRMDKHFVPGLIVNGDLVERVDPSIGGMMVGTKTKYVPGLYMKEKAIGKYRDTVRAMLKAAVEEARSK